MKQGCTKKPVGDICKILNGFAFKSNEYVDDGVRVLRITNVQKGYIVDDDPQFFPIIREKEISKYMLYEGDLLMSLTGNVGRVGVLSEEFLPAALNQRVACLRIKESAGVNLKYLFHIFNSKTFEDDCIVNATGIAQKNMSTKWLENYLIPVPPIAEQEKIVAELDCLSGIIEKKKQQLKELDALAQSIFYEMFGDPVENDKGWEQKTIGSFSKCVAGATPSTKVKEYWDGGTIPWLSSGEVGNGRIYATEKHITQEGYDNASTKLIPPHTVVMALAGQGKTRGTVGVAEIPLCTNQSICSIITNDGVNVDFLYYQLRYLYHELRDISNGDGGRGGLNLKLIQGFKVLVPPFDLQQEFASKIESLEKQKELLAQSSKETETLFNSRMDYYFN